MMGSEQAWDGKEGSGRLVMLTVMLEPNPASLEVACLLGKYCSNMEKGISLPFFAVVQ